MSAAMLIPFSMWRMSEIDRVKVRLERKRKQEAEDRLIAM
jgi:hypothetical protein